MMDTIKEIASIIGTLGFPIAACCVMFYLQSKTSTAINELTKVITELKTYILTRR